jgi:RNA polymerase sigma factor (sigma-70 family)
MGVAVLADGHDQEGCRPLRHPGAPSASAVTSFEDFYAAEYAGVVRLAVALTGRADVAEELAQESFVAAYRRWSRVAMLDDPAGWVRRVVTNRCVSSGRRYVTELRLLVRLRHQRPSEIDHEPIDDELWAAVRSLPRRQAQVVALIFVEDRSVADIARLLGCGEETVRTHLRRGRQAVAQRLGLHSQVEDEGDRDG